MLNIYQNAYLDINQFNNEERMREVIDIDDRHYREGDPGTDGSIFLRRVSLLL